MRLTTTDILEPRRLRQQRNSPRPKPFPLAALRRPTRRRRQHPHPDRRHPLKPAILPQRLLVLTQTNRRKLHQSRSPGKLRLQLHRLRHLLPHEPRPGRPLRLARKGPRRAPPQRLVRNPSRRLHRPRSLPSLQLRRAERLHGAEKHTGIVQRE
jgi:hypothetical protein